jgi:hypothetical protein
MVTGFSYFGFPIFRTLTAAVAGLIVLLTGGSALATDGVIEINQAKVLAHGGFPFTISQTGSYRLTSNLVVPNSNTTAIKVNISDVTIDLNGFSIIGPGAAGSGIGIDATNQHLITIYNGEVAGMGGTGIDTGHSSRIERMRLLVNGGSGIVCSDGCEVSHNISNNNLGDGIVLNGRGQVSSNVTQFNNDVGILAGINSVISDNSVNNNGKIGMAVYGGVIVRGNAVGQNGVFGLICYASASGYADNVFMGNSTNVANGTAVCVNLGQNLCDSAVCP